MACKSCGINLNSNDMPFEDICPYCEKRIDGVVEKWFCDNCNKKTIASTIHTAYPSCNICGSNKIRRIKWD